MLKVAIHRSARWREEENFLINEFVLTSLPGPFFFPTKIGIAFFFLRWNWYSIWHSEKTMDARNWTIYILNTKLLNYGLEDFFLDLIQSSREKRIEFWEISWIVKINNTQNKFIKKQKKQFIETGALISQDITNNPLTERQWSRYPVDIAVSRVQD